MTTVKDRVLEVVQSIPAGRVMTYGDVARTAGTGARMVGRILHNAGHDIPWWRVVNAEGRPYKGAALDARAKFIEEATAMLDHGDDVRVDLAQARSYRPGHPVSSRAPGSGPSAIASDVAVHGLL